MRCRGALWKSAWFAASHDLPAAGAIPGSGNPALRRYTQSYEYDGVGNLLEMKHQPGSGGSVLWKRDYAYASGSNRLLTTSMGQSSLSYDYDARGALANLPHLQGFTRDFREELRKARTLSTAAVSIAPKRGVFGDEELHAYGSVAWAAVDCALDASPRRYRYTGTERDEETGLRASEARISGANAKVADAPSPNAR